MEPVALTFGFSLTVASVSFDFDDGGSELGVSVDASSAGAWLIRAFFAGVPLPLGATSPSSSSSQLSLIVSAFFFNLRFSFFLAAALFFPDPSPPPGALGGGVQPII